MFSSNSSIGDTGTHEVGHLVGFTSTPKRPAGDLRSVNLLKGAGTGDQVECRGVIAVLVGL